jgi:hypothetical protein
MHGFQAASVSDRPIPGAGAAELLPGKRPIEHGFDEPSSA